MAEPRHIHAGMHVTTVLKGRAIIDDVTLGPLDVVIGPSNGDGNDRVSRWRNAARGDDAVNVGLVTGQVMPEEWLQRRSDWAADNKRTVGVDLFRRVR